MAKALVTVDCSELADLSKKLGSFFDESVAKPSPLGKAVAAGARHTYLELQRVTPVANAGESKNPGLLRDSVYRYFDPKASPDSNHISYKVGVNMKKAPHFHLAESGHKVYENYRPFKPNLDKWGGYKPAAGRSKWTGTPFISRNKFGRNRKPLGEEVGKVEGHHFLEKAFNETTLKSALDIVVEEYMRQFKESMG